MAESFRVPGAARLREGCSRKVRVPVPAGAPGPENAPAEGSEDSGDSGDPQMREILLCRVDGRLYALDSRCPHAGGRLAEGPLREGRYASCPLHLYRFDPRDGACVGIECDPATTYRVEEIGTDAEIWW